MQSKKFIIRFWCAGVLLLCVSVTSGHQEPPDSAEQQTEAKADAPTLATASRAERDSLQRMRLSPDWPRRAIVAMRMERYACEESKEMLVGLLKDATWQVRSFAARSLARRGVRADETWFTTEQHPRVMRTALRYRFTITPDRIERGMRYLVKSRNLDERMLAAEIGAASENKELIKLAAESAKYVIHRMDRAEAGALSPRLAIITGQKHLHRVYEWQNWVLKTGRGFTLKPAFALAEHQSFLESSLLAQLESDRFSALEDYMSKLRQRKLDLAICLDCTASMWGELAEAQGGIDDMLIFIGDMLGSVRIGIVGFRDRRDDFETKAWNFTSDIAQARQQLWQLSAEGGGDTPESVYAALKLAYQQFTWMPENTKVLVLIGDAPPHLGQGAGCIKLAKIALDVADLTTHVIQADGKDVKQFPEIAEAGGGHAVTLEDGDSLIAEIAGLTLGDAFKEEFREFFRIYLELCR